MTQPQLIVKRLVVEYFSQLDNGHESSRTCNTVACWMGACAVQPSLLKWSLNCPNADFNYYLPIVNNYGDTTNHDAQTAALLELGVESVWHTDFTIERVKAEIDKGLPVVMGILHKCHVSQPCGFGHMILAVGYTQDPETGGIVHIIVHDPNGEIRLVSGGYDGMPIDGAYLRYSVRNLRPRFECNDFGDFVPGAGYARTFMIG